MDELEIRVFDEIKDYKEKIYFLNIRQWIFAILIVVLVVPTYIFLKDKIGEEITSYIVIAIAGIFGFIGFVKIHELPAEKIIPYWIRHVFLFSKPIIYISDEVFKDRNNVKRVKQKANNKKNNKNEENKKNKDKATIKSKEEKKNKKILEKAKKKYEKPSKKTIEKVKKVKKKEDNDKTENKLNKKLSKLSKEQQEALLKLLEK